MMSRDRNWARHTPRHLKDERVFKGLNAFVNFMNRRGTEIQWYGSRESDVLRLESFRNGLQIKLTHLIPGDHPEYINAYCMCSGNRDEEFLIEVRDLSRKYGLVNLIKEHVDEDSPLFEKMGKVFNKLSKNVEFLSSATRHSINYNKAVREVVKILKQ